MHFLCSYKAFWLHLFSTVSVSLTKRRMCWSLCFWRTFPPICCLLTTAWESCWRSKPTWAGCEPQSTKRCSGRNCEKLCRLETIWMRRMSIWMCYRHSDGRETKESCLSWMFAQFYLIIWNYCTAYFILRKCFCQFFWTY